MLAFLVGLFVILMIGVVSMLGVLLFPLLIIFGFFLRIIVMIL